MRKIESAARPLAHVSEVRYGDIGPGFRNANVANVAHTGFDHRTQPFQPWTKTKVVVNGLMFIGSADRLVQHESNSSKPYSKPTGLIQSFGKIDHAVGQTDRTPDTAQLLLRGRAAKPLLYTRTVG